MLPLIFQLGRLGGSRVWTERISNAGLPGRSGGVRKMALFLQTLTPSHPLFLPNSLSYIKNFSTMAKSKKSATKTSKGKGAKGKGRQEGRVDRARGPLG